MTMFEITEVKVRPYERGDDKLKAFATITINSCFVLGDLKIISGKRGLFVAMPSKKRKDGKFKDIAHPLDNETRQMIEDRVIEAYNEEIENFRLTGSYRVETISGGEYDDDMGEMLDENISF